MTAALPSLFVSHGSPMIALEPGEAGEFMRRLGPAIDAAFGRPKAIVTISAHTSARRPVVLGAARHEAIYDFGGFDRRLESLRYDAAGDPVLATRIAALLRAAGIAAERSDRGGLDHGAWTALRFVYPKADVPIVPLAFVAADSPAPQFTLGRALAPLLGEGVLVFASGSITHNLRRIFGAGLRPDAEQPEDAQSAAFRHWMHERSAASDWTSMLDYRARAPHAVEMHPTDEHLLPWYIAAGAGQPGPAVRLHEGVTMGSLGMDAYAFGAAAPALRVALAVTPAVAVA